ncbi:MAG: hypothetical protein ACRD8W_01490 [Nitrososphaeraceae archaeon]
MPIEIVRDYHFDDEELIEGARESEDNTNDLQIQSGTYELGYAYVIHWSLNIKDERVGVTFLKRYNGKSETRELNRDNPTASFADYWRPYNRVGVKIEASFDVRHLILNGTRCARRETYAGWTCSKHNDVVLTSW